MDGGDKRNNRNNNRNNRRAAFKQQSIWGNIHLAVDPLAAAMFLGGRDASLGPK